MENKGTKRVQNLISLRGGSLQIPWESIDLDKSWVVIDELSKFVIQLEHASVF